MATLSVRQKMPVFVQIYKPQITISPTSLFSANFIREVGREEGEPYRYDGTLTTRMTHNIRPCMMGSDESHFNVLFSNCEGQSHTPSIAFRHPPPNSARFGYATEGALRFISVQRLSTDAVSALWKVRVLISHTPSITFRHLLSSSGWRKDVVNQCLEFAVLIWL